MVCVSECVGDRERQRQKQSEKERETEREEMGGKIMWEMLKALMLKNYVGDVENSKVSNWINYYVTNQSKKERR